MYGWLGDYNEGDLLFLGDWGPVALILLTLLGLAVLGLSWYDLRDMRSARRWTLVGLRVAVYGIAVLMLLEPALELKHVTKVKNHIAVLVDTSLSQTLRVDKESTTRFDQVKDYLKSPQMRKLLTEPNDDHIFDVFSYHETLEPSTYDELTHPDYAPKGNNTRTLEAMEDALRRIGRRDLGGVVLISDGIDAGQLGGRVRKGEEIDQETKAFLRRLGAPVHTVATATDQGLKDLSIERVLHDDFAFIRNKISIDVVLRVVGFDPARIPVPLYREGKLLQTRQVEVGPDATEYKVTFELVPQQLGKEIYTLSAPAYAGEALTENNRKDIVLKIIRDKIRVLQVVGRPSWDERFLRQMLKRNPNVDLISFFILRTPENIQVVPNNELSLIPFPTQELFQDELGSFDLVIFQNFNYGPYNMRVYLPEVAKYVREGGGMVMVGGELSFSSAGYQGTPIDSVLPVILPPQGSREALLNESNFQMELTDAGQRHPITQLAFDPATNTERWSKIPPLEGTNLVLGARPNATVLGVHPRLKVGGEPMPVVVVSEVDKGRVMAVTTDSTWKWSFYNVTQGSTSRPYHTFWNAAIRWLIKDPELKLIKVDIGQTTVTPGKDVTVNIRVAKPDYTPAPGVKGSIEILHRPLKALDGSQPDVKPVALDVQAFTTDSQGRTEVKLPAVMPGAYTVRATATTKGGTLKDEDIFLVTLDSQELRTIEPRPRLLDQLSSSAAGDFVLLPETNADFTFKEPRVVQVNRRKVIDLWDTLWLLIIICGLLGTEWTLRRRWGRL